MYIVDNKFDPGQTVNVEVWDSPQNNCVVCDGIGRFTHNGYTIICPACGGGGKFRSVTYEPVQKLAKIISVKGVMEEDYYAVLYNVQLINDGKRLYEQPESKIHSVTLS